MGMFDRVKKMAEGAGLNAAMEKVKGVGEIKTFIIAKVVTIDYETVLAHLIANRSSYPRADIIIATVETFYEASEIYKSSESPIRGKDFMVYLLTHIDPEKVINEIEPVVNLIPMGSLILMVLKMLLKYKRKIKDPVPEENIKEIENEYRIDEQEIQ